MTQKQAVFLDQVRKSLRARLGADGEQMLLRRIGIPQPANASLDVSQHQFAQLLEEACALVRDPTLAAQLGLEMQAPSTLTAYLIRTAANLRDAIANAMRYSPLAVSDLQLDLHPDGKGDRIELGFHDGSLLRRHRFQEFLVFGVLRRARDITGQNFAPAALNFRHSPPGDARQFARLAQAPVSFDQANTAVVLKPGTLDLPLTERDPELAQLLGELGKARLSRLHPQGASLKSRIETLITKSLPGRQIGAEEVARALGTTRRTLTRHLRDEGTSFRQLLDDLRFDIAKSYLAADHSVAAVAHHLGYSDQAAFAAAFRRWAGCSPTAYRNRRP